MKWKLPTKNKNQKKSIHMQPVKLTVNNKMEKKVQYFPLKCGDGIAEEGWTSHVRAAATLFPPFSFHCDTTVISSAEIWTLVTLRWNASLPPPRHQKEEGYDELWSQPFDLRHTSDYPKLHDFEWCHNYWLLNDHILRFDLKVSAALLWIGCTFMTGNSYRPQRVNSLPVKV